MTSNHETDYWSARNKAEEQLNESLKPGFGGDLYRELATARAQAYAQLAQAAATMHLAERQ